MHMGDYVAAQTLHDLVCTDECTDVSEAYDASIQFSQGVAQMHEKRWEAAAECFRSVLAIAPRYVSAHVRLCVALANLGRHSEAQRCLDQAAALAPEELALAPLRRMLSQWRRGANRFNPRRSMSPAGGRLD